MSAFSSIVSRGPASLLSVHYVFRVMTLSSHTTRRDECQPHLNFMFGNARSQGRSAKADTWDDFQLLRHYTPEPLLSVRVRRVSDVHGDNHGKAGSV